MLKRKGKTIFACDVKLIFLNVLLLSCLETNELSSVFWGDLMVRLFDEQDGLGVCAGLKAWICVLVVDWGECLMFICLFSKVKLEFNQLVWSL